MELDLDKLIADYTANELALPEPVLQAIAQIRRDWPGGGYLGVLRSLATLKRFHDGQESQAGPPGR
jgi:hypothetical protein